MHVSERLLLIVMKNAQLSQQGVISGSLSGLYFVVAVHTAAQFSDKLPRNTRGSLLHSPYQALVLLFRLPVNFTRPRL